MPSSATVAEIEADFDEIAALTPAHGSDAASENWIIGRLPPNRRAVLEIGCGVGDLARRLSSHFAATDAIDVSAGMIAEAKRRTTREIAIDFVRADLFEWLRARPDSYDCIVSVAVLHHVDFEAALQAMKAALAPGGRLLIVDVCHRAGVRHLMANAVAFAVRGLQEVVAMIRGRSSWRLRSAYRRHGRNESYLTVPEVRAIAERVLPSATTTATLFWRYRLLWDKPALPAEAPRAAANQPNR